MGDWIALVVEHTQREYKPKALPRGRDLLQTQRQHPLPRAAGEAFDQRILRHEPERGVESDYRLGPGIKQTAAEVPIAAADIEYLHAGKRREIRAQALPLEIRAPLAVDMHRPDRKRALAPGHQELEHRLDVVGRRVTGRHTDNSLAHMCSCLSVARQRFDSGSPLRPIAVTHAAKGHGRVSPVGEPHEGGRRRAGRQRW